MALKRIILLIGNWINQFDTKSINDSFDNSQNRLPEQLQTYQQQITNDFAKVEQWMQVLEQPYTWQEGMEPYAQKRPEWARDRTGCSQLSCSS